MTGGVGVVLGAPGAAGGGAGAAGVAGLSTQRGSPFGSLTIVYLSVQN